MLLNVNNLSDIQLSVTTTVNYVKLCFFNHYKVELYTIIVIFLYFKK